MRTHSSRRGGFTLPEVLVTVAIVAVLAAMVVPAVTQQISKGDAPAFASSVGSLRTALTSFVSDVRKLPGEVSQLSTAITITDEDLATTADGGTAYIASVVSRWRGPYENSGITSGQIPLGMGWITSDDLVDSLGYVVLTVTKAGAVIADAAELDSLVDNNNGAAAGLVRWTPGTPPALDDPNTIKLFLTSSAR
jgi:prepilin-type N-terminal cleavage/methylation domain-containing protein